MSNSIDFSNHASLSFDELSQANRLEWLSSIQNDALGAFQINACAYTQDRALEIQ